MFSKSKPIWVIIFVALLTIYLSFCLLLSTWQDSKSLENEPSVSIILKKEQFAVSDFFILHENKVSLLPHIITLMHYRALGEWNTFNRIFTGIYFHLITTVLLFLLWLKANVLDVRKRISVLAAMVAIILFSFLRSWEQLLWEGPEGLHLDTVGILTMCLSLIIASRTKQYRLLLALTCIGATIASLSNGLSLWIWPIFSIFFLVIKKLRIYVIPWGLVGCMVFSLYFWNFTSYPFILNFKDIPFLALPSYLCLYLSGGLFTNAYLGLVLFMSFIGMSAFLLVSYWKKDIQSVLVWVLLACYCMVYAFFQAYIDMDFSIVQSTSSEAYGISILFLMAWLALLVKLYQRVSHKFFKRALSITLSGVMLAFLCVSVIHTNIALQNLKSFQKKYSNLERISVDIGDMSWDVVPYESEAGHVDVISHLETGEMQIIGWAQHPYVRDIVEQIYLVIDGQFVTTDRIFIVRRDVSDYWKNDIYRDSGWMITSEEIYDAQPGDLSVFLEIDNGTLLKLN